MPTFRGFVLTIEVRTDGWVETVIEDVTSGNTQQTFFIPDVDGDITQTNKRLGQLSLLRDALARVLPVELDYSPSTGQGALVTDVIIHPRPSIDGRPGVTTVDGVVIGLAVTELWPQSDSTPYLDGPDLANVVVLTDAGSVVGLLLDLQRPDPLTAQDELKLLDIAYRTRRPVELLVSAGVPASGGVNTALGNSPQANDSTGQSNNGYIQSTRFKPLPERDLDYVYAFIERLGQRYESYNSKAAPAISHFKVVYTTAPGQTPEGDVSDNGSFAPQRLTAWVHDDSPLVARLDAALRDSLQVKLGLHENQIHEVELIACIGSAARPVWIVEDCKLTPCEQQPGICTNVPTIQSPGAAAFAGLQHSVTWQGKGYFQYGIWRFNLGTGAEGKLTIDGHPICCNGSPLEHAFLEGMHCVELELCGVTCSTAFTLQVYRIR